MRDARRPPRAVADAVVFGLAALLGTGLFLLFAPAAAFAGRRLPVAVALAGVVAALAALGGQDLLARAPGPAAAYRGSRERLGAGLGRVTGVSALLGRVAAAAAAARVFGDYVLPGHAVWLAVVLVLAVGGLTLTGGRWTERGAWALVVGLLLVLAVVVGVGLTRRVPPEVVLPLEGLGAGPPSELPAAQSGPGGPLGVAAAAGVMFFGYAGFTAYWELGPAAEGDCAGAARSRWVLPVTLLVAVLCYLAVAAALLHTLGTSRLAVEPAPLVAGVGGSDVAALGVLVRVAAAAATTRALFGALSGGAHTAAGMAAAGDLPSGLARLGGRGAPGRAVAAGTVGAALVAALVGPVPAMTASACCALIHYAVLGVAALRLPTGERCWPRGLVALGPPLCLALAALLPTPETACAASAIVLGWLLSTGWSAWSVRRPAGGGRGG